MRRIKEPPLGSVVIDASGSAWQRHPIGWSMTGSDRSWSYTWKEVEEEFYIKMTGSSFEWDSVLQDPRLPLIVYVPFEELIVGDED
jgi:hypothetical protein